MGIAIAKAAANQGAQVELIVGSVSVDLPNDAGITVRQVETTEELLAAVDQAFEGADALVMAAAVADFRMEAVSDQKIKKDAHGELILKLVKTPDILKTMGQKKGHRLVVGFAAETTALVENGMAELKKKTPI